MIFKLLSFYKLFEVYIISFMAGHHLSDITFLVYLIYFFTTSFIAIFSFYLEKEK
jgi:hypothetical protein